MAEILDFSASRRRTPCARAIRRMRRSDSPTER
jgi:hypothetical protein